MAEWEADDGTIIHYDLSGDERNEVLVMLPGLLGAIRQQWQAFDNPLSQDFRVLRLDLRGHGRSTNQAATLAPARMMQDIAGLLDTLGIGPVHICGYSLGGYLGLMLALNQPRRVQTLVMHATKFYWTPDAAEKMKAQLDPDVMAERVPAYADQLVQDHGARRWRELLREAADLINTLTNSGLKERTLPNVQCPALVSVGERDELVPIPEALRMSRALARGELIVLPGVRHPYNSLRVIPFLPMIQYFHMHADRR